MNLKIKYSLVLSAILMLTCTGLQAQTGSSYTLQQLIDSAISRSHPMAIKSWQVKEKVSKLNEDQIRRYPSVMVGANYQYNFSIGELNIPAGSIGVAPTSTGDQLFPQENTNFKMGQHDNFSTDVALYQPLLQQAKIKTGLAIDKIDVTVSETEQVKIAQQLTLAVQELYYGILISEKQWEAASTRLELAKAKVKDAESGAAAGKVIAPNLAGLRAAVAEEEQNMLKQEIIVQDYKRELIVVANLSENSLTKLQEPDSATIGMHVIASVDTYTNRISVNTDLQLARLNRDKALLSIKAANQSNLPDLGLIAGYYYQRGNPILPTSMPYIGINLKWNLQDLFVNHHVLHQREAQLKQAEHTVAYQQQKVYTDVEKAYRKINQTIALVTVARKALKYRLEELKVQKDKQAAGLSMNSDLLAVKADVAKSEADLYAAQLAYFIAVAELENLIGR
ncbi:TolC family protein [Chryseolinea soli]|uniref:TolC family protein n=1 Tax=Chryseolinea soli TaxID=2321403 RepID=A0A385SNV8_9BACT|nr:TolC family protein [Chryseolinea soli]AYB31947.1 TolC family protein [Chryseolinea soli]